MIIAQSAIAISKLTIEALEQGVKYLTIKISERRHSPCSSVSVVNFEQVNAGWEKGNFPVISKEFYVSLKSSVIRQKCESQNRCFKKTKHANFPEKRTFLTS